MKTTGNKNIAMTMTMNDMAPGRTNSNGETGRLD